MRFSNDTRRSGAVVLLKLNADEKHISEAIVSRTLRLWVGNVISDCTWFEGVSVSVTYHNDAACGPLCLTVNTRGYGNGSLVGSATFSWVNV